MKVLGEGFAVESHDIIGVLEIPHLGGTITRINGGMEEYAEAEAAIMLATGLNSTKATFL